MKLNTRYLLLPALTAITVCSTALPALANCGSAQTEVSADKVTELVKAIEAKFELKSNVATYKCGGTNIHFGYKPPIQIVDPSSRFKSFNDSMGLGEIPANAINTIPLLENFLGRSTDEIANLKMANASYYKDRHHLEMTAVVDAYDPNAYPVEQRVTEAGQLLFVTMAHCFPKGGMQSAEGIGTVNVPVFTIEAMLVSKSGAPLYKQGDTANAIRGKSDVRQKFVSLAIDNYAALSTDSEWGKWCSKTAGEDAIVDWQKAVNFLSPNGTSN